MVESITIAHTSMVPPKHLGFSVSDDIIAPRSGIPVRPLQPADAAEPAEQPDVDVIPAAEDAEPSVEAREDGMEHHEVWVDGVKLDTNSPLRTLRAACDSLGLSKSGGKVKCLKTTLESPSSPRIVSCTCCTSSAPK